MKRFIACSLISVTLLVPVFGQNRYETLRDFNNDLEVNSTIKKNLDDLVVQAQDFSQRGFIPYSVLEKLLKSYLCMLDYLEMDGQMPTTAFENARNIVSDILHDEYELRVVDPPPPPGYESSISSDCQVNIFAYVDNDLRAVPNGRIEVWSGSSPHGFVAVGAPDGGLYSWEVEPEGILRGIGKRFSFRALQFGTHRIRVTYSTSNGKVCQDQILVVVK